MRPRSSIVSESDPSTHLPPVAPAVLPWPRFPFESDVAPPEAGPAMRLAAARSLAVVRAGNHGPVRV